MGLPRFGRIHDARRTMDRLTYQLLMRCPIANQWVPTGLTMDRASFESATFAGGEYGCSACREIHRCEKGSLKLG